VQDAAVAQALGDAVLEVLDVGEASDPVGEWFRLGGGDLVETFVEQRRSGGVLRPDSSTAMRSWSINSERLAPAMAY